MDPLLTLPAESFTLPNGSPAKTSAHSLAGNILWAVGHAPESREHSLFYFHGIKGGSLQWHKFSAPLRSAGGVQLEVGLEGGLGVRMDAQLFLGTVESVAEARISWSTASDTCADFQLGKDRVCIWDKSGNFTLAPCDLATPHVLLPPPPKTPDCFCMSPRDDVIILSASSVLLLAPPYLNWVHMPTLSPPRTFLPSIFAPKETRFKRVCVSGRHLCALSQNGETLSLLPISPSPAWQHTTLQVETRDLCPISGPPHALCFLLLDRHFSLSLASLETGSIRARELPHSLLPDKETLFSSVRSLRSNLEYPAHLDSLISPLAHAPPPVSPVSPSQLDDFFTAAPPELQPMEVEPTSGSNLISAPFTNTFLTANPADQLIPSSLEDLILDPSSDLSIQSAGNLTPPVDLKPADLSSQHFTPSILQSEVSPQIETNNQPMLPPTKLFSNSHAATRSADLPAVTHSKPTAGSKRHKSQSAQSPSKFHRGDTPSLPSDPPFYEYFSSPLPSHTSSPLISSHIAPRTSEEKRTDKRRLRETANPCPLPPTSFLPFLPDFSHFQTLLHESESRVHSTNPLDETEDFLFHAEFKFELFRQAVDDLDKIYPNQCSLPTLPTALPTSEPEFTPSAPPTLPSSPTSPDTQPYEPFQL